MKRIAVWMMTAIIAMSAHANSGMPGLWQPGANGKFIPLFADDSVHFGKVRMQQELIRIDLFPGYAVVKGEYYMYNSTDSVIDMHVAYPKQARFSDTIVDNVIPSYIDGLKVLVNDGPTDLMRHEDSAIKKQLFDRSANKDMETGYENWFVWQMRFAPKSITKITVYFVTDNSTAKLRKGYRNDKGCAFSYVLESGRAWGGSIDSGRVCVKLNGGLTLKDVKAVLPFNTITGDDTHLLYAFTNKEPTEKDNMLIWYAAAPESFSFKQEVLPNTEKLYAAIDRFDVAAFNNTAFKTIDLKDLEIHSPDYMAWTIIGILGVAVLLLILIIWGLVRWLRRRSRK